MSNRVDSPSTPKTPSTSDAPPPRDIYRHADGSCEISVLADDTPDTLYCAAYGDGVTGGAGQLATWLFAEHGGLPEAESRLHLPEHERMLREASRAPQKTTEAALRCLKDGISCREFRAARHQEEKALAGRAPNQGLAAPKATATTRQPISKHVAEDAGRTAARQAVRAALESARARIVNTAKMADTPSSWQKLAADMLTDVQLGSLATLRAADLKREVVMLLRPDEQEPLGKNEIDDIASSLCDGISRAAGHQFFQDVQTRVRVTLEDIDARLRDGTDPAALRDGLQALGPEQARVLVDAVASDVPIGSADHSRVLAQAIRATLAKRTEALARMPDPAHLVTTYPGVVAAFGAARGVGVAGREPVPLEPVLDKLERVLAPLVPALELKRGLERVLQRDVQIRGDNLLATGLRQRCDFEHVLDLTYALVSKAALGSLTTDVQWEGKGLPDALVDELKSGSNQGAVELLGWSAEQAVE